MAASLTPYRGRFAPSPSGPLHLGSLIAAVASFLDARHQRGTWLVRMEDLDPPREQPGAADAILHSLEAHGLHWDEEVLWQSPRADAYAQALTDLQRQGSLFNCDCTRAMLGAGGCCNGRCEGRQQDLATPFARRICVAANSVIEYTDEVQGLQHCALGQELPDFVLRRKDGLDAYQLAVVVDDEHQGITHIVRGSDLLDSTARQIYLQQQLGYPTPHYAHLPVITNKLGQKFSKQNHAPALENASACQNLRSALHFLQQSSPPAELHRPGEILDYATRHWSLSSLPRCMDIPASSLSVP